MARASLMDVAAQLPTVSELADRIEETYGEQGDDYADALRLAYVTRSVMLDVLDAICVPTRSPAYPVRLFPWVEAGGDLETTIRLLIEERLEENFARGDQT